MSAAACRALYAQSAPAHRAIFLSIDSFNEQRALTTLDPTSTVAIRTLFTGGACVAAARPAFPSLTSPGHASLWTGAYGNVNGVSANWQPTLPRSTHTLLDRSSGYLANVLRAEPLWITAGASGLRVTAHHVTQAPQPPAYPSVDGAPDATNDARRARASRVLATSTLRVVNGYNRVVEPDRAIDELSVPPRAPRGWTGLAALGRGVAPREIAWRVGADSVFALLFGAHGYTSVLVSRTRDARHGVVAHVAPVERAPIRGRPLARHYSAPLVLPESGGAHVWLRVRLFEVDSLNASRFLIVQPRLTVVEGNHPALGDAYQRAIGGWVPNGASSLLSSGRLGATIAAGGDGTAELRYLETTELVTRQFLRGSAWAWRTKPTLMFDYFPVGDETDHQWYSYVVPGTAPYVPAIAAQIQQMRERAWTMVDLEVAQLERFAHDAPGTALFVGGDHGMRPTWREFLPNVVLANGGLLVADSGGRVDLTRTRALSPNGAWVMLNRTAWRGGIVAPTGERALLDSIAGLLMRARGDDGEPIVTRIWRAADVDSLGAGGPTGGDIYYDLAPGYHWNEATTGPVTRAVTPHAEHGYPSTNADMQTVFCALGPAFPPHRIPAARTIDEAPTIAAWLGIPAPPQAVGHSVLDALAARH